MVTIEQIDTAIEDLKKMADLIAETEEALRDTTIQKNKYRDRLEEAVDTLADLGIITNTPYAKRLWIEGE